MCDCCCIQCIRTGEYGVLQRCGEYDRILDAGFHCILYPIYEVYKRQTLRVNATRVSVNSKSKDNVTIDADVIVQYKVHDGSLDNIGVSSESGNKSENSTSYQGGDGGTPTSENEARRNAVYALSNVEAQIRSYVENVVRGVLPRLTLDEIFSSKDELNTSVKEQLQEKMAQRGWAIVAVLVINLGIAPNVASSMNEINASALMRMAAKEKAEAEKILSVKSAEAEAESKYLLGAGVAKQRKAIVDGLKQTVSDFSDDVEGASAKDVMDLLLLSQYFDVTKNMGGSGQPTTLFLPHGPQSIADLREELVGSFTGKKGK